MTRENNTIANPLEADNDITDQDRRSTVELQAQTFVDHLNTVARAFNDRADELGLGVRLDVSDLVELTLSGRNYRHILGYFADERPGVLYEQQIVTAVDAIVQIIESPHNLGLILGALQSGKTTTALALQFAGPAVYLTTGQRLFPFYLTTSQNSHERQFRTELAHFMKYYGGIDVVFDDRRCNLRNYVAGRKIDPAFDMSPNLDTYRDVVLDGDDEFQDIYKPASLSDLIHKRVRGEAIPRLALACRRMVRAGFSPLMIIDEPQFGASDRIVRIDGEETIADCLLTQIEKKIAELLGDDADRVKIVGLSATPFELHALKCVWTVFQRLGATYRGFNDFGGTPVDSTVAIEPPDTISVSSAAVRFNIPFLPMVNPTAYSRSTSFDRWARKIGYSGTWEEYRQECAAAMRELVLALIDSQEDQAKPVGICLRAINDNDRTEQLLNDIDLPTDRVEVIRFYGNGGKGMAVKQVIAQRARPDLPYLFLVTSKARMGDQFPSDVRYFIDCTQQAGDLNALLQGLVGRACGYGKESTVVLSDQNQQVLDAYVESHGDYVIKPSRHSVVAGNVTRVTRSQQLTIERNPGDRLLESYFTDIDRLVVAPLVPIGARMKPRKAPNGGRRGPILTLAEAKGLVDHIESTEFRAAALPHVFGKLRVVRLGESVELNNGAGSTIPAQYLANETGECRFNFRQAQDARRAGIKGRGRGKRDAKDTSLNDGILEPSIGLRKRDPLSEQWIDDPNAPGEWVAVSVTLPLHAPCTISLGAAQRRPSLPAPLCVYERHMTDDELSVRDGEDAAEAL
jgi:hypothetical protein